MYKRQTRISLKRKKKRHIQAGRLCAGLVLLALLGFAYAKNAAGKGLTERLMGMEMALLTGGETMTAAFEEDEPWALEENEDTAANAEPVDTEEPASVTAANAEVALCLLYTSRCV